VGFCCFKQENVEWVCRDPIVILVRIVLVLPLSSPTPHFYPNRNFLGDSCAARSFLHYAETEQVGDYYSRRESLKGRYACRDTDLPLVKDCSSPPRRIPLYHISTLTSLAWTCTLTLHVKSWAFYPQYGKMERVLLLSSTKKAY
jgi:hypothetical protein